VYASRPVAAEKKAQPALDAFLSCSVEKRRKSMLKPAAVIRKVEDSPDWLDQRLVEAYLRTAYVVVGPDIPPVRVGVPNPALERWLDDRQHTTFAFITAWNPGSVLLPAGENEKRLARLAADLRLVCPVLLEGWGRGDSGLWPAEASLAAIGISPEAAIRFGRRYGQNAVVWWEKGGLPELWWL
jgi:hypothetical protein